MKKCYLDGYLRSNLGDDLLFFIMTQRYPEVNFFTYSDLPYAWLKKKSPNLVVENPKSHINKSVSQIEHLFNIFKNSIGKGIFINLGGSIFIYSPSRNPVINAIKLIGYSIYRGLLTFLYHDVYVVGANFGPFANNNYFFKVNKKFFTKCRDVCFRDKKSFELFKDVSSVRLSTDIVFSYNIKKEVNKKKQVFVSLIDPSNKSHFSFNDKEIRAYYNELFKALGDLYKKGYEIVLSAFCTYQGDDKAVLLLHDILNENGVHSKVLIYSDNLEEIIDSINESEYVIGTRFHASVLGIMLGCKTIPIIYSNKTTNMLSDIGFPQEQVVNLKNNCRDLQYIIANAEIFKVSNDLKSMAENQFQKLDKKFK